VLSGPEQQAWEDIERFYALEVEEPVPAGADGQWPSLAGVDDLPGGVVAGAWITIVLVIFGALVAGLAVGAATALAWIVWHRWPRRGGPATPTAPPSGDVEDADRRAGGWSA
jgi:hypothetical protein